MTSPDSDTEADFVQFVCFRTVGPVPLDLFQQSWIPFAEELFARGIKTIILSEKLPLNGDFSPSKFIAKNYWASITAVKRTFEKGLPSPSSRGHITVFQVNMVYIMVNMVFIILKGLRHWCFKSILCFSHYLSVISGGSRPSYKRWGRVQNFFIGPSSLSLVPN